MLSKTRNSRSLHRVIAYTTLYGNIAGIWSDGNIGGMYTKVLFLTLQAVSGVPLWFQKHSLTQGDGWKFSPGYTGIFGCHPRFLRNLPESTPSFHICAVIVTHIDERTRRVLLHTRLGWAAPVVSYIYFDAWCITCCWGISAMVAGGGVRFHTTAVVFLIQ